MVFHRARPWRARRPAFGTRAGTRLRGTPAVTGDPSGVAAPLTEAQGPEERTAISVLGIRRRYWEVTHGWTVPTRPQESPEIETPGRVA